MWKNDFVFISIRLVFRIFEYGDILAGSIGNGTQTNAIEVPRLDDNLWHFLTLRWDGAKVSLFVDTTLVGSVPQTIAPVNFGPVTMGFGGQANGAAVNGYLDGQLDEVRIYNRAITDSEMISHYNNL